MINRLSRLAVKRAWARLLQDALALLDKNERRVVMLHAAAGMKHREIAVLLEMPLATVLSKYHRAIKKLRAFMKGAEIV